MRRLILVLWLMTGPALAQEESVLLQTEDARKANDAQTALATSDTLSFVRVVLLEPEVRRLAIEQALLRWKPSEALVPMVKEHFEAVLAEPSMRNDIATRLADTFTSMGVTPADSRVVARMAGEQLSTWGSELASAGMVRLSADEKRRVLGLRLQIVAKSSPEDCADYLTGKLNSAQNRLLFMSALASLSAEQARATFVLSRRAILAELEERPKYVPLSADERSLAGLAAGAAISAALQDNPKEDLLYAAFGYPDQASKEDICAAHRLMLQTLQDVTGRDGVLIARYLIDYGLNG